MNRATLLLIACLAVVAWVALPAPVQAQTRTHGCGDCHGLHGAPLVVTDAVEQETLCLSCHDGVTAIGTVAVHAGAKHTDTTSCRDCHDHFGETEGNLKLIPRTLDSKYPLATGGELKTIVFTSQTGGSYADDDSTDGIDGVCEVCHEATDYHTKTGTGAVHNSTAACPTCHTHESGFQPNGCTGCHDTEQPEPPATPVRRAIVPEFELNSHHINLDAAGYATATDIEDADCEICHDQAAGPHQSGQVWLKDVDTPANGPYNPSIAADVVAFCTACHDADGAAGAAPFPDGMNPPVVDATAWLATPHGTELTVQACLECHTSGHGNTRAALGRGADISNNPDTVCNTCHGAADPPSTPKDYRPLAKYTPTHADPNNTTLQWEMACTDCHLPHFNEPNRYYYPPYVTNIGDAHLHDHTSDAGGLVVGINIKLVGRQADGSGIAKVATPVRILSEGTGGPCIASDIQLQIAIPPYSFGEGPPHTIMVGDRITLSNAGPDFPNTTTFRVKETVWDNFGGDPPSGWVCFDNPANPAATTSGFGYVQSDGWYPKPVVGNATWDLATTTATLTFSGPTSMRYGVHSIKAGDWINVIGVSPTAYNGQWQVTAADEGTVSYEILSDPGLYVSGGAVEYVGSVKDIASISVEDPPPFLVQAATWTAGAKKNDPNVAQLTLDRAHTFAVSDTFTVSGIDPAGFNGTFTVLNVPSATQLEYELANDPGPYVSGGSIADTSVPGGKVLVLTLQNNSNHPAILDIKGPAGARDGDIVTLYGVNPIDFDGRWEVLSVDEVSNPPTVTLRCGPELDLGIAAPPCTIASLPLTATGGVLQSSGSLRAIVYESRGTENYFTADYLSDWTHSFTNTDNDEDGWMDGPCELCHTLTSNHKNDDYANTHNNGKTCVDGGCHSHTVGFDKDSWTCPRPSGCPATNGPPGSNQ